MKAPRFVRQGWFCLFVAWISATSFGQTNVSQNSAFPTAGSIPGLGDPRPMQPGQPGGGSLANFSELMQLIQTMVPSSWEAEGGEDSIQPYPNGVWIDPNGKLQRQKLSAARLPLLSPEKRKEVLELPQLGELQSQEEVRWISLRAIEQLLRQRKERNEKASPTMELLGGLARIDFIARDPSTNDWLLGGPAGDIVMDRKGQLVHRATGLPPVLLEDLLSVAPLVLNGKGPMGCSIDPVPERLKAVSDLANSPLAKRSLAQQAAKWSEKLAETLGDQQAVIFGLPEDSPTGIALLIADEHMKRLGLGLENGPPHLLSYWEEAEKRGALKTSGLIRWWFALRDDIQIASDELGTIFKIDSPTVQVMSQRQWVDRTGARHEAADQDHAADAFAAGFTDQFAQLQSMYPMYGRLRHIFDLSIAMRIIREEVQAGRGERLEFLMDRSIQPHASEPLKWVPSTVAWRKTSNGRVTAIVSGGVAIEVNKTTLAKQSSAHAPAAIKPFSIGN